MKNAFDISRWRPLLCDRWSLRIALGFALILGLFCVPEPVGKGERLDPVFRVEELISQHRYQEALGVLRRIDVGHLDAWDRRKVALQRAVCLMRLEKHAEALDALTGVEAQNGAIADYLAFWEGQCAEAMGQPDRAVAHYRQVLDEEPVSLLRDEAALRAAELAMDLMQLDRALTFYERLVGHSCREADALAGVVRARLAMGDSAEARQVQLQLVCDYPEHPAAEEALRAFDDADDVELLFHAGVAAQKNKRYRQATALLKRVMRTSSDPVWQGRAQFELGNVYYDRREYRLAERAFDAAYKTYKIPRALFEMARCAVKRGHDITAATRFLKFQKRHPRVAGAAEALWQAGMAYERRDWHRRARQAFLRLARTYPKSSFADQAAWRAGFALYQTRQYKLAAQTFLRLSRQTPERYLRDQGYYWAGKCFQKLGKKDEAAFWIQRAAEGFPTSYYSARARAVLGLNSAVYPATSNGAPLAFEQTYEPSVYLQKGDLLASVGLYADAEAEYDRARRVHRHNLFALDDLLQRYERIRSMHKALQVSGQIVMLEQQQGLPMTLASFRRLYPTYYWGEINRAAEEMGLDPNLMIAIMRQESAFNKEATSRVGARGLMQVMPSTGKAMARRMKMSDFSAEDLWDPLVSIRLGGRHLSDHLRSFRKEDGRRLGLALSAYNAGLTAARRWSRRLVDEDVDEFVESIPYKETRNYVKLVYRNYQVYSYLQGDGGAVQGEVH